MAEANHPEPPQGLRDAGTELWNDVIADLPQGWELDRRELHLLALAARQVDVIVDLEAVVAEEGLMVPGSTGQQVVHPAVSEARQGRIVVDRLLSKIVLPSGDEEGGTTGADVLASHAARARWSKDARRRVRHGS